MGRAFFLFIALIATGAEYALMSLLVAGILPFYVALILHLALCSGIAALAAAHRRSSRVASRFCFLTLWIFIAGPWGGLIGLVMAFASNANQMGEFGEWFEREASGDSNRLEILRAALLCRRLRINGSSAARSLRDVVADGTIKEKYDVLNIILRRFDPVFVPSLRLASVDSDQSVRVLAATVAVKLHKRYSSQIADLQAAGARVPTADTWRALADAHESFARSGLLSPIEVREQTLLASERRVNAMECMRSAEPERLASTPKSKGGGKVLLFGAVAIRRARGIRRARDA